MDFLFPFALFAAGLCAVCALLLFIRWQSSARGLRKLELELASLSGLKEQMAGMETLRALHHQTSEAKASAQTRQAELEKQLAALEMENVQLRESAEAARSGQIEAEKHVLLMQHKMQESERRMQDWEAAHEQAQKSSQAAMMKVGNDLSTKLLEDHKREMETARKESEERTQKVTDGLLQQFVNVTQSVASLKDQTTEARGKMEMVWKALTTPAGAGYFGEIGLENSLKNLGLEPGCDFIMQYSISSGAGGLRPDAVIFLPQDRVMVVDSKASKFLIEASQAEDSATYPVVLEQLKRSMTAHLRALVAKDYRSAIEDAFHASGRGGAIQHIFSVMCLPNEAMIERLKEADNGFMHKAQQAGIIVASPATLSALFSVARHDIGLARQAENQEKILLVMQGLMGAIKTLTGHAERMGRGMKTAADAFVDFTGSFNRNILPKLKNLQSMGVAQHKQDALPAPLTGYQLTRADGILTVENEEEESNLLTLQVKKLVGS